MSLVLSKTTVKAADVAAGMREGFMNATDLADLCVQQGMPFRQAHEKVGALVRLAIQRGVELDGLRPKDFEDVAPGLSVGALKSLDLRSCIESKNGVGGTASAQVKLGFGSG